MKAVLLGQISLISTIPVARATGWAIREDDYQQHPLLEQLGCDKPQNPSSQIDRPLNHFFDVQRGGRGLTIPLLISAIPALDWTLGRQGQGPDPTQNQFSIRDARVYQLQSLTAATREEREKHTALLFRTLGQAVHVLQDMAQPQHTRNDPHTGCLSFFGGERSWYEDYLERRALREPFRTRGEVSPPLPLNGYPPPSFSNYQDFWTASGQKGLADFSSRNFFSAGTNLSLFGNCGGLPEPPCRLDAYAQRDTPFSIQDIRGTTTSGNVRLFLRTIQDPVTGAILPDVPVTSRSVWDQHLEQRGFFPKFSLNTLVYDAISDLLLPRAVGYSAGLLDYFFRGRLDVDLVEDPEDPLLLRLTGTNASDDTLVAGTLALYADDPAGRRTEAGAVDPTGISGIEKAQALPPLRFQAPEDAERFVAVYHGTLGQEVKDASRNSPGAVIGKVLGGVRVEEVFSDGVRWYLRTPQGVYPLGISAADVEDLRWGEQDNRLVGRSRFGSDQPNTFFVYEIARPQGSTEIPLVSGPDGSQMVKLQAVKQVPFPVGIDPGTKLSVNVTVNYKQYLASLLRTTTWTYPTGCGLACTYLPGVTVLSPPSITLMESETQVFQRLYAFPLDLPSASCCERPYVWAVEDFAVTTSGQVLALVRVAWFGPEEALTFPASTFAWPEGSDRTVPPERVPAPPISISPRVPDIEDPLLWVVVDVESGRVVGSTTPGTMTVTGTQHFEFLGNYPSQSAVFVTESRYVGGPLAGTVHYNVSWAVPSSCPTPAPPGASVSLDNSTEFSVSQYGADLQAAQFPVDVVELPADTWDIIYGCSFTVQATRPSFRNYSFGRIDQAILTTGTPGNPQVVLLMVQEPADSETVGDRARIVSWSPVRKTAEIRQNLPFVAFHELLSATSRAALVSARAFDFDRFEHLLLGTSLVTLQGAKQATFFPDEMLGDFVLLEPDFLYNTEDLKFYRKQPPLQRTALPAKLAPFADNPYGAYHLVRLH